jgi:hypothetical protein
MTLNSKQEGLETICSRLVLRKAKPTPIRLGGFIWFAKTRPIYREPGLELRNNWPSKGNPLTLLY